LGLPRWSASRPRARQYYRWLQLCSPDPILQTNGALVVSSAR
jgi:hypothetical protein